MKKMLFICCMLISLFSIGCTSTKPTYIQVSPGFHKTLSDNMKNVVFDIHHSSSFASSTK